MSYDKMMIQVLRDKMDKMPFEETKTTKAKNLALEVRKLEVKVYSQLMNK